MNEVIVLLLSFIAAEAVFLAVLYWTYNQLKELPSFRRNLSARRLTAIVFFLLPLLLAGFLLPGLIQRLKVARLALPQTGVATPIAQGILTATVPGSKPPVTQSEPGQVTETPAGTSLVTPEPTVLPDLTLTTTLPTIQTTAGIMPVTSTATITGTAGAATLDGLKGKIAYTCQLFGDTDRDQICLIYADGTGYRRLTTQDQVDHNFPTLSPDGSAVMYASNETGVFEIYEMNLDSGTIKQVTNRLGDAIAPDISPDGTLVVFTLRKDEHQGIWIMTREGKKPYQVYGPPLADGWDPTWSPDGSQILFTANPGGRPQLFNIQPDGSGFTQITQMQGILGGNSWSPDGLKIATYLGESWNREIYILAPDGSNPRQVTNGGNNLSPSFSPDGNWIVFTSYRDRYGDENGCEIYVMNLDGSQVRRLTNNTTCDWQPNWGP